MIRAWRTDRTEGRPTGADGRQGKGDVEDLDVDGETTISGVVTGRVHVGCGGILVLTGRAAGGVVVTHGGYVRISGHTESLFVAVGGEAVLTGICPGLVVNDGGRLKIEGTVDGVLVDQAGDTTITAEGSVSHTEKAGHGVTGLTSATQPAASRRAVEGSR